MSAGGKRGDDQAGSALRYSDGKPRFDLIPVRVWLHRWGAAFKEQNLGILHGMMIDLRDFQEGDNQALRNSLVNMQPSDWMSTVAVLEYGATKYDAWNWAKGMAWSKCIGSALRHAYNLLDGRSTDSESGLSNIGHIGANFVFLDWYAEYWRPGDDRPPIAQAEGCKPTFSVKDALLPVMAMPRFDAYSQRVASDE
ncbi:MAG: hypothetical protein CME59_22535 [Halioglobus sp.]|nr:hypothetical protein [Halioglobus sp.]|tara:strand:- start:5608 stop:6195 length:588 start_codon:yes stop_codon:yes gene_type:complete